MRRRTVALAATAVVVVLGGGIAVAAGSQGAPAVREQVLSIAGTPDPDGSPVTLDATIYLPADSDSKKPAPSVILAHGFGGSKDDEASDARYLAQHGYVALTYSARGFGHSTGEIALDSPDYEVADAKKLVDLLASRPEVLQDGPGDPRVGITGPSYGGALSLLAAGYDPRIDAIVPVITWNNLQQALFPQFAVTGAAPTTPAAVAPADQAPADQAGVFKKVWAGEFFGSGSSPSTHGAEPTVCGRFTPQVCTAYQASAVTGDVTPDLSALLTKSSPSSVLGRIKAPTLLIQGEDDSLFPLSEADANARGIAAGGTSVKVEWFSGGHDSGVSSDDANRLRSLTLSWFDRYLKQDGSKPDTTFAYAKTGSSISTQDSTAQIATVTAPGYPGTSGTAPAAVTSIALTGGTQTVVSPAGGNPAALTSVPGLGSILSRLDAAGGSLGSAFDPPGQSAEFESARLAQAVHLAGAPSVDIQVTSTTGDATLFAKLYDVPQDGGATVLPEQLVSPIRLTGLPTDGVGTTVHVSLPAVVHDFAAGHRLRLVVASTDQAYQLPQTARAYRIALASSAALTLPSVPGSVGDGGLASLVPWAAAFGVLVVATAAGLWFLRRRSKARAADVDPELEKVPLAISGLGKHYGRGRNGFRAVTDLSFRVEPGQVLGLLGPNGAGKTTALRMVMGLIQPTEGETRVFGHRVTPGAPVLSRVGAFIEGPGFLPHLSGLENLELSWAATGRPTADADIDAALELAGLGESIHRKVRAYSQGMRQRLAVAQAMLGLPDLLVLDEPTNGLDPPQIRQMREALRSYAQTGRTVVVSSHLLAEVEQTCTHCVVMARGRLVASGSVEELLSAATSVVVDVDAAEGETAAKALGGLDGVDRIDASGGRLVLRLDGIRPAEVVRVLVGAGVGVDRVAPQNQLEDVFLHLLEEDLDEGVAADAAGE